MVLPQQRGGGGQGRGRGRRLRLGANAPAAWKGRGSAENGRLCSPDRLAGPAAIHRLERASSAGPPGRAPAGARTSVRAEQGRGSARRADSYSGARGPRRRREGWYATASAHSPEESGTAANRNQARTARPRRGGARRKPNAKAEQGAARRAPRPARRPSRGKFIQPHTTAGATAPGGTTAQQHGRGPGRPPGGRPAPPRTTSATAPGPPAPRSAGSSSNSSAVALAPPPGVPGGRGASTRPPGAWPRPATTRLPAWSRWGRGGTRGSRRPPPSAG